MKITRVLTNTFFIFSLLFTTCFSLSAQKQIDIAKNYFENQIKSIDSLIGLGQPESAKKLIVKFKSEAEKYSHTGYKTIALNYLLENNSELLEEPEIANRVLLDDEITKNTGDYKALLLLEKASLISNYYDRYSSGDDVSNDSSESYDEWSNGKIYQVVFKLVNEAIILSYGRPYSAECKVLDREVQQYDFTISFYAMIINESIAILSNFKSEDKQLVDSVVANLGYNEFVKYPFETHNSNNLVGKILSLYQELCKENKCYFDAERLQYVNNTFVKSNLYEKALPAAISQHQSDQYSNCYVIKLVSLLENNRPKEALKFVDEALARHPNFKLNNQLLNSKANITFPDLNVSIPNQIAPDKPSLMLINYKNVETVYYECYKIDPVAYENKWNNLYYRRHDLGVVNDFIESLGNPATKGNFTLIDYGDYKTKNIEVKLPALQAGVYLIAVHNKLDYNDAQMDFHLIPLVVNKQTIVAENSKLRMVSAENGQAIKGENYTVYKYSGGNEKYVFHSKGTTEDDGTLPIALSGSNWYNDFFITTSDKNYFYKTTLYKEEKYTEKDYTYVKILTDRGLYRPGQTVQFKCIAYKQKSMKTVPKIKFTVNFFNNGENKGKMDVTTNAYGSAVGKFKIPESGTLSGEVYITVTGSSVGSGNASIRVEEYKLPKFAVELKNPDSAYKLDDVVKIKGNAKALAGYAISGAKYTYTIKRSVKVYPYYSYWSKPYNVSEPVLITKADGLTDNNGEFVLEFKALSSTDERQNSSGFTYTIDGSVTDINGEVKTFNKELFINQSSLVVSISGPQQQLTNKDLKLLYSISNTFGKQQPVTASIQLYKIEDISEAKKPRFWQYDTTLLTEQEYASLFSDVLPKFPKRNLNLVKTIDLKNDTNYTITIDKQTIQSPGDYIAKIVAKDKEGRALIAEQNISILPSDAGNFSLEKVIELYHLNGKMFEPGETAKIAIASGFAQQAVKIRIMSKRGVIMNKIVQLNRELQIIDLPVLVKDRGNIEVFVSTVNGYRDYQRSLNILVPFSNKQLQVKVKSFRSDLEPGSREKWVLSMTGPASEKAAMELAAVMYDAALDEIVDNFGWQFNATETFYNNNDFSSKLNLNSYCYYCQLISNYSKSLEYKMLYYPSLHIYQHFSRNGYLRYNYFLGYDGAEKGDYKFKSKGRYEFGDAVPAVAEANYAIATDSAITNSWENEKDAKEVQDGKVEKSESSNTAIRKNFNETAFFFPQLYVDAKGEVSIEFAMPEALTKWKLMLLGHSTTLQSGSATEYVTTSKQLMVQPNLPRFLRERDQIVLSAKIINNGKKTLDGKVKIVLKNEMNGEVLNWVVASSGNGFSLKPGEVSTVQFNVKVPDFTGVVSISISAETPTLGDGELKTLAVLSNRTLVQTAMPFTIRKAGVNQFDFNALLKSQSTSLVHQKLSVEICNNPAWNAVMAMPYLMEYPNECAEQLFSRIYANSISLHLIKNNPKIKEVYAKWQLQAKTSGGFNNKLEANQNLKLTVLSETPWLSDASAEKESMAKMAALFKENTLNREIERSMAKLEKMQKYNGGFSWFSGMYENEYITQTIVIGFGKLSGLGVDISKYKSMISKAVQYIDNKAIERYNEWMKRKDTTWNVYPSDVNYLYAKSYFPSIGISTSDKVLKKNIDDIESHWMRYGMINKANLAVALKALKPESAVPALILKSFTETAKKSEEMGMYWSNNKRGWYWYEAPEETQAAIIEAYAKVGNDMSSVKELQVWLLRQKQTHSWASTKSTADAIYVLLKYNNLLNSQQALQVKLGSTDVEFKNAQAGTGYARTDVPKESITTQMGKVTVTAKTSDFSYGAVHWQYFEDMDKVSSNTSGLSITKSLYITTYTNGIETTSPVASDYKFKVGDIITVVLNIASDRNLEFVHVKDMRASGTEPLDVLSEYKYQNGLGYYMVTKDASTNFFIDYLNKGKYQLSYKISIQQAGEYSSGIAQIQCMYAPEFIANSAGMKMKVE